MTFDALKICDFLKPRLHAWMRQNGWRIVGEAAGNVHWTHESGDHIWLDGLASYAVDYLARVLTGAEKLLPVHGSVKNLLPQFESASLTDIIATISMTEPENQDQIQAQQTRGGGLLVVQKGRIIEDTSWGG